MALRLEDKQALVAEVKEVASSALSAVAADYRGMTVAPVWPVAPTLLILCLPRS